MSTKFIRLRDGTWGVKSTERRLEPGDRVQAQRRSLEFVEVTVGEVVWRNPRGIDCIARIAREGR